MLALPKLLMRLVKTGRWPATPDEQRFETLNPRVTSQAVAKFAPGEESIFLYTPPFSVVAALILRGDDFWTQPCAAPDGLDHTQAIIIGDFGLGADAPIVLDYRQSHSDPCVLRLQWSWSPDGEPHNKWVEGAASFSLFVEMLGL